MFLVIGGSLFTIKGYEARMRRVFLFISYMRLAFRDCALLSLRFKLALRLFIARVEA